MKVQKLVKLYYINLLENSIPAVFLLKNIDKGAYVYKWDGDNIFDSLILIDESGTILKDVKTASYIALNY